jgi:hypothetical protein
VRKVIIHKNHLNGNGGNFTPYPAARTHSCVYVVRKTPRDDWDAIDSVAVRRKAVATAITPQVEGDDFISAAVRERRRT